MLTASFLAIAIVITVVVGGALSAWLWSSHCRQLVTAAGLRALAAMRWREYSRFVIEALQQQGFEASRMEPDVNRGQQADLLLMRGGETWLLSCKQGVDYRVTTTMVEDLARAVRGSNAHGGILATLGRIDPEARRNDHGIELVDGATLWPLIDPLLPPSLHRDLVASAHAATARTTGLAWVGALALGLCSAYLLANPDAPPSTPDPVAVDGPAPSPSPAAPAPTTDTAAIAAPVDNAPALPEAEQRREMERGVSVLPGIERASWATHSTLMVQLLPSATEAQIDAICTVVERSEALAASRVQLQPAPGSDAPVRFMQCRAY